MQQVYVWYIVSLYIFEISFICNFVSRVSCAVLLVMAAICDNTAMLIKKVSNTLERYW